MIAGFLVGVIGYIVIGLIFAGWMAMGGADDDKCAGMVLGWLPVLVIVTVKAARDVILEAWRK